MTNTQNADYYDDGIYPVCRSCAALQGDPHAPECQLANAVEAEAASTPLWGYRVTRQRDPSDFLTWHWFNTVPVRDGQIMAARAEAVAEAAQALDSTDAGERVIIEWVQLGNTACQMCGCALTDVDVEMVDMFSALCLDCERVLAAGEGEAERREEEAATAFHNGYGFSIQ